MNSLCVFLITVAGFVSFFAHEAHSLACPDGWTPHQESCYLFLKETYNWFDAKSICEELGGMLAEVADQDENHYLVGLTHAHNGVYSWIGLQDFLEEGSFVWTNSKRHANPAFWNAREPGDNHGEEDCGAIYADGWADSNCEDAHYTAICETAGEGGGIIG